MVAKIPSTHDGVVTKINYKNDDICLVGRPLVELELEDGKEEASKTKPATKAEAPKGPEQKKTTAC